ncbi:KN motif and ankyrin repeat domain-containing protein 2-like [Portunus trituberculatus]|uniref:KN motif and ankyrin repeat domain-containing protein 2-like n=1 Tax=Portunus trituberculatus TaxID=210409 RepID=UPI001E1CC292|nr:KN motif and ankyrin repeat domain-containing protein 2-like [Portunus trituberculatus]
MIDSWRHGLAQPPDVAVLPTVDPEPDGHQLGAPEGARGGGEADPRAAEPCHPGCSTTPLANLCGPANSSLTHSTLSSENGSRTVPSWVLNNSISKPVRSSQQLTNALNIIQREWLKVPSQDTDPHTVEDDMEAFEDYSKNLLQKVVNLANVNVHRLWWWWWSVVERCSPSFTVLGNTAVHYAISHSNFDVVSMPLLSLAQIPDPVWCSTSSSLVTSTSRPAM